MTDSVIEATEERRFVVELDVFPTSDFAVQAKIAERRASLSSPKVIEEAEKVAQLIVRSYPEPNMTFADLRPMITAKAIDPLRSFSESCREELERLK